MNYEVSEEIKDFSDLEQLPEHKVKLIEVKGNKEREVGSSGLPEIPSNQ